MSDILQITDILITDYSSSLFDFALLEKPIILFLYDINEYEEQCRSFYTQVDIKNSGLPTAYSNEDLIRIIEKLDHFDFSVQCRNILKQYDTHETGTASLKVCSIIGKLCGQL